MTGTHPATHDFKRSGERRGRLRRILVSLLIVCVLLIVSALAMYFWLMGGTQQGDMSLRVQTSGAANGRSEESVGGR
jgi:flagellar basal body-associated protein FliL